MAVHGVSRSTSDLDLLVTDARCLDAAYWTSARPDLSVDIRRGDPDDPLAGVVRLRTGAASPALDVIVGRHPWQAAAISAAVPSDVEGVAVPVVRPVDLILLKLYTGGPQDTWDVTQLLGTPDRAAIVAAVEGSLTALPDDARRRWRRITTAG